MTHEKIAIIGAGRLGRSLALALCAVDWPIVGLADRSLERAQQLASECALDDAAVTAGDPPADATVILLCVPDDAIAETALNLALLDTIRPDTLVAHCSGAMSAEDLAPLRRRTPHLASIHPMQMFPGTAADAGHLRQIHFALEGERTAIERLQVMVHAFNSRSVVLSREQKELYHLACVFSSNYLMACQAASVEILSLIGFGEPESLAMLSPLSHSAIEPAVGESLAERLTGPIVRGDVETIQAHIAALNKWAPQLCGLYAQLAKSLLRTQRYRFGSLTEKQNSIAQICSAILKDQPD